MHLHSDSLKTEAEWGGFHSSNAISLLRNSDHMRRCRRTLRMRISPAYLRARMPNTRETGTFAEQLGILRVCTRHPALTSKCEFPSANTAGSPTGRSDRISAWEICLWRCCATSPGYHTMLLRAGLHSLWQTRVLWAKHPVRTLRARRSFRLD